MGIAVLGPLLVDQREALSPRDQVVLEALVAAGGTALSAEVLSEALWGESPPASWRKLIPSSILRIRKTLGSGAIETTAHGYRLAVHGDTVDSVRFVDLVERGHHLLTAGDPDRARHVLREALGLWRGHALAEVLDWEPGRSEAERLDEVRREAEEAVLDASLRAGLHAETVAEARSRVAQEPLRERRWALLALAQYLSGDQADALETLREARRRLADELGLDPGAEITRLEDAILRQDASLVAAVALPEPSPVCPYPGLRPFDVDDGEIFFGRATELAHCLLRLQEEGVLVVVGPSGSGKSSLLRAGIVASLRRSHRPTQVLGPGPDTLAGLRDILASRWRGVLVVDQLEEVLAACSDDERDELMRGLVEHAHTGALVVSLRADHLGDVADHSELSRLVERGLYLLGPLREEALRAAIEGPAAEAALILEPGLVDVLVREVVDAPGALPLMAHALEQTWLRREGRTLTVTGYRDSGGIDGAVAQTAEGVFDGLDEHGRAVLRDLLLRLVSVTPDGDAVRVWVPLRRLSPDGGRGLVEVLARARLVAVDEGVVAVAHESLARAWPRLRAWLEDDVEGQRILRHLSAAADSWDTLGRPDSELYRGIRLTRALGWRSGLSDSLTPTEEAFLAASQEVARHEEEREVVAAQHRRRQRRRTRGLVAGLVALILLVGTTAGMALVERGKAADAATARQATVAAAAAHEASDPTVALVAGVEAVRLRDGADTRAALLGALTRWPALLASRVMPDTYDLDVWKDGRVVIGGDDDVTVVDATSLAAGATQPWTAQSLTLLPDGHRALVGTIDRELAILDMETGERAPLLEFGDGQVWGPQSSADAKVIVAGVWHVLDGTSDVVMWRGTTPLPTLRNVSVADMALSPDGELLYLRVESPEAALVVHDVATGRRTATTQLEGRERAAAPGSGVTEPMVLSPDGRTLALGGEEVVLIDAATLAVKRRLANPVGQTVALAFSPDGKLLAGGSDERSVSVWDVDGTARERIEGMSEAASRLAFSPDGSTLYTLAKDHRLSAWDLRGDRRLIQRVRAGRGPGLLAGPLVVPAPDGEVVAYMYPTGEADDRAEYINLLDVTTGRLLEPVKGTYQNWGVWRPPAFEHLAVPGDLTVRVWDWRTRSVTLEKDVGQGPIESLAYTPDGRSLIVGERGGHVFRADAATLTPTGPRVDVGGELAEVIWAEEDRALAILQSGGRVKHALVDLETGQVLSSKFIDVDVTHADISPDGRLLAIGGNEGEVGIIDLDNGEWVKDPLRAHQGFILRVDFSSDGSLFVTSGADGRVRLWDGRSGVARESTTIGRVGVPSSAIFAPDGHTLVLAAGDGTVRRWDTRVSSWAEHACETAGRNLTSAEWALVFGDQMPFNSTCPGR